MSNDKYYDGILAYITENGETGVNVLAKHLEVPLSTMQRYLEKQTYFRKTVNRKWDLPTNVESDIKSNTMTLMVDSVENALKLVNAQMAEVQLSIQNALMPVSTLRRAVDTLNAPVAGNSANIYPELAELDKKLKTLNEVFKKYVSKVPEEYQELIKGADLPRLVVELGTKFFNSDFNAELTSLFLEQSTELSEDVIELLKEYQRQ